MPVPSGVRIANLHFDLKDLVGHTTNFSNNYFHYKRLVADRLDIA